MLIANGINKIPDKWLEQGAEKVLIIAEAIRDVKAGKTADEIIEHYSEALK